MKRFSLLTSIRDLFAPIVKVIDGILFEPLRYGIGKHYNAEKYWCDRFKKFGMSLRASANRQLTEEENEAFYRTTTQSILAVIEKEKIVLENDRILDIGCGTGYYTRFCCQQEVTKYTGLDITDVLFPELQKLYPDYYFTKQDLTQEPINDIYDCILMLDVMEHITNTSDLKFAMQSILNALSDKGVFIVAPVMDQALMKLSYVRYWTLEEIKPFLADHCISTSMPFPDGTIIAVRKS